MKETEKVFQSKIIGYKENGSHIIKAVCINDRDNPYIEPQKPKKNKS